MSVELRLVGGLSAEPLCTVRAERSWSVGAVKREVERLLGVSSASQRLLLSGSPLRDSEVLERLLPRGSAGAELALVRLSHAPVLQQLAEGRVDLEDLDEELRADFDVVMAAVRADGHALRAAPAELRGDGELALAAVRECGLALQHASPALQGDRELVLAAVQRCGAALQHASADLRGDPEVVSRAVRRDQSTLSLAAESLRGDRDFMESMIALKGTLLQFATEELKQDRSLVLAAVASDPYAFAYAAGHLQSNRDFVLKEVIPVNGCAIQFASGELKGGPEIVAIVKQKNPEHYAVPRCQ